MAGGRVSGEEGGMRVYKVIRGRHSSAVMRSGLVYKVGRVTRPRKGWGPLAAFRTRQAARRFMEVYRYRQGYGIWQAQAEVDSKAWTVWAPDARGRLYLSNMPEGTILCKSIRLEKEVEG